MPHRIVDFSHDLAELTRLTQRPDLLHNLLERALHEIGLSVPYDLAAILRLDGPDHLRVRATYGRLAQMPGLAGHSLELEEHPSIKRALDARAPVIITEDVHSSHEGDVFDGVLDLPHGHSCMVVPLFAGARALGVMTFDRVACEPYPDRAVELVRVYGQLASLALLFAEQADLLARYKDKLSEHTRLLSQDDPESCQQVIASLTRSRSERMQQVVMMAQRVAPTSTPVLITGETGTGKELFAQAVHCWSPRRGQPMVKLNCAAIPEALIESELFGHVKGAYSGAVADRPGRFLTANNSTLLLDEVGELPPGAQSKLLRVLQEGTFEPVGSDTTIKVDVRIVAATHVNLKEAVARGEFREDLYYRLAVFPLELPALRDRREDILSIVENILSRIHQRTRRGPWFLSTQAALHIMGNSWPGNIRELVNALERATILADDSVISLDMLMLEHERAAASFEEDVVTPEDAADAYPRPEVPAPLDDMIAAHILSALEWAGGKIYGDDGAAAALGLKPSTLQSKMKKLGIKKNRASWRAEDK